MLHTFNPCSSSTNRDMRERKKTSQLSSRFCCIDKKEKRKKKESQGITQWVKVIRINEVNLSLVCQRQYFELVEKEKIERELLSDPRDECAHTVVGRTQQSGSVPD